MSWRVNSLEFKVLAISAMIGLVMAVLGLYFDLDNVIISGLSFMIPYMFWYFIFTTK